MIRATVAVLVVSLALGLGPRAALAGPSQQLAKAREAFRAGDWQGTIVVLYPLLSPPVLATAEDLSEGYVMMGVAYYELGDRDHAAQWFEEALFVDDGLELDDALYSPEAVAYFRATKAALQAKLAEASESARLAREREAYRRALENALEVERHPRYVSFLPFGAGQFQNGQRGKGTFFAVSEATLGGISLLTFGIQWFAWGIPLDIPPEDLDLAANIQRIQVATGVLFFAAYAWSVVDALVYYRPSVTRRLDPRHIPEELTEPTSRPGARAAPRVVPNLGPGGANLTLAWEF